MTQKRGGGNREVGADGAAILAFDFGFRIERKTWFGSVTGRYEILHHAGPRAERSLDR